MIEADGLELLLGAQHCHWEEKGAFTGEVSPAFLAKLDVKLVICGHSERRDLFGETDEMVNRKVKAILKYGMTPIMCCGESLAEREAGETEGKVLGQIAAGLAGLKAEQVAGMVIAYEPIWAIGTGRTATADDAQTMCRAIRTAVAAQFGADAAASVRIQYGGSVKAGTTAGADGASPTSTERWSAAPVSTPTSSPASCSSPPGDARSGPSTRVTRVPERAVQNFCQLKRSDCYQGVVTAASVPRCPS